MGWFDWPVIPHPGGSYPETGNALENVWVEGAGREALSSQTALENWLATQSGDAKLHRALQAEGHSLHALVQAIDTHGSERCIGVFAEWVQERTGATASDRFWRGFASILKGHDIPVVMDETSTGFARSGHGFWRSDQGPFQPDVITCFAGGQLGHVFVSEQYFLAKPLQLISTWDGDEVSALRLEYFIQWFTDVGDGFLAHAFEAAVREAAKGSGVAVDGEGFFLSLAIQPSRTDSFLASLRSSGILAGKGVKGRVLLTPGLTEWTEHDIQTVQSVLHNALENQAA